MIQGFQTYLMHELASHSDYRSGEKLCHWRSTSGFEVDFIIGDHTAVEVKAKSNVSFQDVKPLRALESERRLISPIPLAVCAFVSHLKSSYS